MLIIISALVTADPCMIPTDDEMGTTVAIIWQGSSSYLGICRPVPKSVRSGWLNLVAKIQELNQAGTQATA